jgi:hypothetical protein
LGEEFTGYIGLTWRKLAEDPYGPVVEVLDRRLAALTGAGATTAAITAIPSLIALNGLRHSDSCAFPRVATFLQHPDRGLGFVHVTYGVFGIFRAKVRVFGKRERGGQ